MAPRVFNFSAGPATLPREILEEARDEILDYRGSGMSVMELSHRSEVYGDIHHGTLESLRRLLGVPEGHDVLLLQGGASLQFAMVPMNLMRRRRADYVLTGSWSKKAAAEAGRVAAVRIAASTEREGFRRVPEPSELDLDPEADYLHLTTNNTIFGTQWRALPESPAPLVSDASSDLLSRPLEVDRFGLIYAGAQKNLGPAGVTVVVVRRELMERAPDTLPAILAYRTHAAKQSLYNTPPCWAVYMMGLACRWLQAEGGLPAIADRNRAKAQILYQLIDASGFYRGTAETASRSQMNVTFRLPGEELERRFLAEAEEAGMVNLGGHRSVGGIRASIYNAMPVAGVERLASFMTEFQGRFG